MASPQTENGYTSIAHEILEQVARQRFNGIQRSIIDIVWRYTYGFKRKSHQLAASFIAEAIEADIKGVKVELAKLIQWKVVLVIKEGHGARPRTLSFNKNYDQWIVGDYSPPVVKKPCGGESYPMVVESSTPLVGESSPPKITKKKTLKKEEIKDMDIPSEKIKFHDTVFLTQEQYKKLCEEFGKRTVDDTIEALDEWQSNKKPSQHKKDHNKTLRVWIKKDQKKPTFKTKEQKKLEEMELLKQFSQGGGMPHEQSGDLQLAGGNQNGVS
ncbi:replication protein [Acinetobacter sp. CUI P1]|nr:replication protein [Acinetobacter sp. CUI P1]